MKKRYAQVVAGTVVNVLVLDDDDPTFDAYCAHATSSGVSLVEVTPDNGPAYVKGSYASGQFRPVQPPNSLWDSEAQQWVVYQTLVAEPVVIPPDNTTAATVIYTSTVDAPTQVVFNVNGTDSQPVDVVNGVATVNVTSQTPNDVITVTAMGMSVAINVSA